MIAVCIGHSRGDGGAVSVGGVNEWHYNRKLGRMVVSDLQDRGFEAVLVDQYTQGSYGNAMRDLAATLKAMGAECAVELHFNSSDTNIARGHEWLHWHSSVAGRALAQCLQRRMTETFPEMPQRYLKPIRLANRGAEFLRGTHCPAVICEPFFGSNATDWELATAHCELLARVIADGIDDWKGGGDE